jgi:hypothetical protein
MVLEYFDEATHMGAAKLMRQVDRHSQTRNRLLGARGLIENHDWVSQIPNADVV